jgi:hypothetical protein
VYGFPTTTRFPALQRSPFFPLLPTALLLGACAVQTGRPACQARQLEAVNAAALPVEQLYYGAPGAWGEDLLGGAGMAVGEARPVVLPGLPGLALRVVWTDGHAIELRGLDPCRNARIVMAERVIRAD